MKMNNHAYLAIIIVLAISLFAFVSMYGSNSSSDSSISPTLGVTQNTTVNTGGESMISTVPATEATSQSTDKTYDSGIIAYAVPSHGGSSANETIEVKIDLDGQNRISSVETTHSGSDRQSARYQQDFDSEYKQFVVGKSIDEVNISRVAGASLTTDAFMEAINQIKNEIN